jgi:transcription termination factor Rho
MAEAKTVADVIAGEAVSGTPQERWNDMVHIASVIANRAAMLGVTPQEVVSVQSQFNAYNKAMPAGTAALTGLAEHAIRRRKRPSDGRDVLCHTCRGGQSAKRLTASRSDNRARLQN